MHIVEVMHDFLLVPAFMFGHEVDSTGEIAVIVIGVLLMVTFIVLDVARRRMALTW